MSPESYEFSREYWRAGGIADQVFSLIKGAVLKVDSSPAEAEVTDVPATTPESSDTADPYWDGICSVTGTPRRDCLSDTGSGKNVHGKPSRRYPAEGAYDRAFPFGDSTPTGQRAHAYLQEYYSRSASKPFDNFPGDAWD